MSLLHCKQCAVDVQPVIKKRSIHNSAFCPICDSYIKHVQQVGTDFQLWFGKHNGEMVSDVAKTKDGYQYLVWLLKNFNFKPKQKSILEEILK
jgi:hypothetical protein